MDKSVPKIDLNQIVIEKIEKIRVVKGLSQKDFANLIGLSPSAYNRIKNGEVNLTLHFIQNVSESTNYTISEILEVPTTKIYNNENHKGFIQNGENSTLHINLSAEQFDLLKNILKDKD